MEDNIENNKSLTHVKDNYLIKVRHSIDITNRILNPKDEKNIEWWNSLDEKSKRILWNNLK